MIDRKVTLACAWFLIECFNEPRLGITGNAQRDNVLRSLKAAPSRHLVPCMVSDTILTPLASAF